MANIFQTIENTIAGWFSKAPQEVQDVLTATNKFLNTVKVLSTSATGQTIIDLAEAFFPAATGIVSGAETILSDLLGITSENPGQLLLQAAQKAASLTGAAQVAAYSNLATAVASAANMATGGTLTPQQIVSVQQLVHNPSVLSTPTAVTPAQNVGQGNASTIPNAQVNQ